MMAIALHLLDMATYFLNANADVNIQDSEGFSALHLAIQHTQLDCFNTLLAHPKINVTVKDCNARSVLMWLVDCIDNKKVEPLVRQLLEMGADVSVMSHQPIAYTGVKENAVSIAMKKKKYELLPLLIRHPTFIPALLSLDMVSRSF